MWYTIYVYFIIGENMKRISFLFLIGLISLNGSTFCNATNATEVVVNKATNSLYSINNGVLVINDGVISIDRETFKGNKEIKEVILPASLKSVGLHAFRDCSEITKIQVNGNVEEICMDGFINCTKLKNIEFNTQNIGRIGIGAFMNCEQLESVTFPKMRWIEGSAFLDCKNLKDVTFNGDIDKIHHRVFENCDNLSSITFNGNIEKIDPSSISNCPMLRNLTFPATVNIEFNETGSSVEVLLNSESIGSFYNLTVKHGDKVTKIVNGQIMNIERDLNEIRQCLNVLNQKVANLEVYFAECK